MTRRIGFYICHCGINIAYRVNVEEVAAFARSLPNVAVARDYKFMCSDPGQAMIEKDIEQFGLTRVVVASCSPRLHGKTFMGACQRAGLNPYYFQMASVREQVSWVTLDAAIATAKAKTLVAGAINRVNYHERLETRHADVHPDILVVGGGIAGMQAALDIADAGHHVYLVEKDTTIGGHMLQFDKTFPTLDCAACIGTPKMVEVSQNANIELLSFSEVTAVSGFVGNYKVNISRKPRYVKEGICTGCGECETVCPVSIPNPWDVGLGNRKAIGRAFPQAIPITFNIEKKDRAPCTTTCPAGVNVQGYVQLIAQGNYTEAVQLILQRLPLPGTLGRVCPHPCETECRRNQVDAPVSIRALKRFAADQVDLSTLALPAIEERPEKIAVIGSGPAGLTAALDLRLKGFQVTLLEAMDQLGGMLRVGIPDYRLPPKVLNREIDHILRHGIQVRTGTRLGTDFDLTDLQAEGFGAVFLGIGAHGSIRLGIAGEKDTTGVIDAIGFLRDVNLGSRRKPGDRVVIIGGGNVAIDAARAAKRLGATAVTVVYRRSATEMPAYAEEIDGAREEGITMAYLTAPMKIQSENGRVSALECIRTTLGPPDASGRRRPVPEEGSEFTIPCDTVIPAIGQKPDIQWAAGLQELQFTARGTVKVNPVTCQSSLPYLFACGDIVTGPATVIEAVLPESACGVCSECMECVTVCEANAIDHSQQPEEIEVKVGSIILATGYDLLDPTAHEAIRLRPLLPMCSPPRIRTPQQCHRPTGGKILMRDDTGAFTRPPGSVALLHCIGSRDVNYHEYCSRVCCMYALKYTHLIKEKVGHDTKVYDFYIDMRCFGEGYEEFYRRCQEEGTTFIRGKWLKSATRRSHPEEEGKLVAIAEDTLLGKRLRVPVDMVVLCSAIQARSSAVDVGRIFGVNIGADGFFLEEHPKLGPLNTATDGVFLAGCLPDLPRISRTRSPRPRGPPPRPFAGHPGHVAVPRPSPGSIRTSAPAARPVSACVPMAPSNSTNVGGIGGQRGGLQRLRQLLGLLSQRRRPGGPFNKEADFCGIRRAYGCRCRQSVNSDRNVKACPGTQGNFFNWRQHGKL
jgi:heterodisulfide reductase subunit A-like polyferredoxin